MSHKGHGVAKISSFGKLVSFRIGKRNEALLREVS